MSPILWQDDNETVALIDIPTSIANAQGSDFAISRRLLSSVPLQQPFPSNEPKTQAARAKVRQNDADHELHLEYQHLLREALDEVRNHYSSEWCLPRVTKSATASTKKRRLDDSNEGIRNPGIAALPNRFLSNLARQSVNERGCLRLSLEPTLDSGSDVDAGANNSPDQEGIYLTNSSYATNRLSITSDKPQEEFSFLIPPRASFYLADCTRSREFRRAVRQQAGADGTRSTFDFILLDPPWPSRSVKRTHQTPGSTYAVSASVDDIRDLILDTHLEMLMERDCLVAVWITNRPSVRELVLGENGIFDCWDVQLVEEWIWLKSTVGGEPITALDGVWRKPYEVLLLGRRCPKSQRPLEESTPTVKRRVVVGVPDLHSRKPCLKLLIEPMMKNPADYRALEVFSRHLVAGWWSWGDECIKFNWEEYWFESDDK